MLKILMFRRIFAPATVVVLPSPSSSLKRASLFSASCSVSKLFKLGFVFLNWVSQDYQISVNKMKN